MHNRIRSVEFDLKNYKAQDYKFTKLNTKNGALISQLHVIIRNKKHILTHTLKTKIVLVTSETKATISQIYILSSN